MLSVPLTLGRHGHRRAQRPDRAAARLRRRRRRPPPGHRRPAGGHRGEGPPPARMAGPRSRSCGRSTRPGPSSSPSSPTSCGRRWRSSAPTPTCWPRSRRSTAAESRDPERRAVRDGLAPRRARPDRAAGPAGRLDPRLGPADRPERPARGGPGRRRRRSSARSSRGSAPLLRRHRVESCAPTSGATSWPTRRACARSSSTSSRTPSSTPRRTRTITVDCALVEGVVRIARLRRGPGHPGRVARADLRAVRPPRHPHRARLGDRAVRGAAPDRESMGARLWCEPAEPAGARFVVALPAAAAV